MIEIQIELNVCENKMDEVLSLLYEDKSRSHLSNGGIFNDFKIIKNINNKIKVKAQCESMDIISQHMTQTHYRWHESKQNGSIISHSHRFITI